MTAKYGKLSIGFAIAPWIVVALLLLTIIFAGADGWSLVLGLFLFSPCGLLGIIFSFVGMIKKESPKRYYIIGFLLNAFPSLWCLGFIGSLF